MNFFVSTSLNISIVNTESHSQPWDQQLKTLELEAR